jgi:hypothetical protein
MIVLLSSCQSWDCPSQIFAVRNCLGYLRWSLWKYFPTKLQLQEFLTLKLTHFSSPKFI